MAYPGPVRARRIIENIIAAAFGILTAFLIFLLKITDAKIMQRSKGSSCARCCNATLLVPT